MGNFLVLKRLLLYTIVMKIQSKKLAYLKFRKLGWTFARIGKKFGVTHQAVQIALSKNPTCLCANDIRVMVIQKSKSDDSYDAFCFNCFGDVQLTNRLDPKSTPRVTLRAILKNDKKVSVYLSGRDVVREIVRIRDNRTCQNCNKVWVFNTRRFDIHHLNGLCGKKSYGYDKFSEIDGLITLCHQCHFRRHDFSQRLNREMAARSG